MQSPSINDRLAKILGQLIIAIEEKTVMCEQLQVGIQQLEGVIADLKAQNAELRAILEMVK